MSPKNKKSTWNTCAHPQIHLYFLHLLIICTLSFSLYTLLISCPYFENKLHSISISLEKGILEVV